MRQFDRIQQRRHRLADRGPVRRLVVAGPVQGVAQLAQGGLVTQFGHPGAAQQRAQRRIAERGPVKLAEMGVAAVVFEQQGVAHLIQRRAILPGRQGAESRPGDVLKIHPCLSGRPEKRPRNTPSIRTAAATRPQVGLQALENLYE